MVLRYYGLKLPTLGHHYVECDFPAYSAVFIQAGLFPRHDRHYNKKASLLKKILTKVYSRRFGDMTLPMSFDAGRHTSDSNDGVRLLKKYRKCNPDDEAEIGIIIKRPPTHHSPFKGHAVSLKSTSVYSKKKSRKIHCNKYIGILYCAEYGRL
ncbi:hypothetical protein CI610_03394 [invertebrate metagenome]|uniref:Uncharacterized protein n=1 Tax=invertebrate metagenome TaxID=1711999 RepID=A0A2H9T365_9ZZZZ